MKALLTDFLDWMNEINSTNPMQLETDHDDIAMMYLDSGRAETVVGQVSVSSANGETAGNEKLCLPWKESELIGGDPLYFLDESHGVGICDYVNRIEIRFFERVKENNKYYCRIIKKHIIDIKDAKEKYELIHKS